MACQGVEIQYGIYFTDAYGTYNFEVADRCLENLFTPGLDYS